MARRKQQTSNGPSKAYLVSFGDTMTALLAFFIVINSLAKEQTGANLHAGTGSFARAFSNSGLPGGFSGNRSQAVVRRNAPRPIYALSENNSDDPSKVGPDDTDKADQIQDRDKEQFQKFLSQIEKQFRLDDQPPLTSQTAIDSFEPMNPATGGLSRHAVKILSEAIPKLRQPTGSLEIVLWTPVPSPQRIEKLLDTSLQIRSEVEDLFWLNLDEKRRIRYRVKPWLFSDAKRPVLSVILASRESPR
jgi:hypothetical protein